MTRTVLALSLAYFGAHLLSFAGQGFEIQGGEMESRELWRECKECSWTRNTSETACGCGGEYKRGKP